METLYGIIRQITNIQSKLLLEYTTLEKAAEYMRVNKLDKIGEKHFTDTGLVIWIVL